MKEQDDKILLIGIGNSAREDDGLGWAFVEHIEQQDYFKGTCVYKFQLNLEDAELISHYKKIIFVDAFHGLLPDGYAITLCSSVPGNSFSTHLLSPETVLYLCKELYGHEPQAWMVGIQGYHWELKEYISKEGEGNLWNVVKVFRKSFYDDLD